MIMSQKAKDETVAEIVKAKQMYMDALGIANGHFYISGMIRELVVIDINKRLSKALLTSVDVYNNYLIKELFEKTGINIIGEGLQSCKDGPSNGNNTVLECPVSFD